MTTIPQAYQKPLHGSSVGVVFGSFAPLHQGHMDMIFRAKKENDGGCIVVVCGNANDKGGDRLPLQLRYRYTREFFKDDDLVAVYAIDDDVLGFTDYAFENWYPWLEEFDRICDLAVADKSSVEYRWYVGELEYAHDLTLLRRTAVLMDRRVNPISATMIRRQPLKYWDKIALPFRRAFSHNILIIGTASEGKTVLTRDIAKYYGTACAFEWPREYMEKYSICDWELNGKDFATFLFGQSMHIAEGMEGAANRGVYFVDSDALTTDMYACHYSKSTECALDGQEYGEYIAVISDHIIKQYRWDKIFVLPPHGKFVDDHSRYMHDADIEQRMILYGYMLDNLKKHPELLDVVEVLDGNYYDNFKTVRTYVDSLYESGGSNA